MVKTNPERLVLRVPMEIETGTYKAIRHHGQVEIVSWFGVAKVSSPAIASWRHSKITAGYATVVNDARSPEGRLAVFRAFSDVIEPIWKLEDPTSVSHMQTCTNAYWEDDTVVIRHEDREWEVIVVDCMNPANVPFEGSVVYMNGFGHFKLDWRTPLL